jgi:hypothetical protein
MAKHIGEAIPELVRLLEERGRLRDKLRARPAKERECDAWLEAGGRYVDHPRAIEDWPGWRRW